MTTRPADASPPPFSGRLLAIAFASLLGACAPPPASAPPPPRMFAPPPAPPPEPERVAGTVHGSVRPALSASLDDSELAMPRADLELDAPADLRVGGAASMWAAPPMAGYSGRRPGFALKYQAPAALSARSWSLHITRYSDGKAIRTLAGEGPVPDRLEWDGLDASGEPVTAGDLLLAQLDVRSPGGAGAASPRVPFGVAASNGPLRLEKVAVGAPFGEDGGPNPELVRLVDEIAAAAVPGTRIAVAVHDDGAGDRLESIARTQRESQRIVELLGAAGVPGSAVEARGRGSLEPLEAPTSTEARQRNRRVVAVLEVPQPETQQTVLPPPSAAPPVPPGATLSGVPLRLARDGTFSFAVPPVIRTAVLQLRASDGRRAATVVRRDGAVPDVPAGAAVAAEAPASTSVDVVADPRSGTVSVNGRSLPAGWSRVRVELAPTQQDSDGVRFALRVPGELRVRSWHIRIEPVTDPAVGDAAAASGPGRTIDGDGAPPRVWVWDGLDDQRRPVLEPGRRFRMTLEVRGAAGHAGWSPAYEISVPPARWRGLDLRPGRLFRGTRVSARLKNFLSRFATVARRRRSVSFDLRLEVGARRGTMAERRLLLAARVAAARAYILRLGVREDRFELHGALVDGRDGRGSLRVGELATRPELHVPPPASPLVVVGDQAATLDEAGRVSATVPLAATETVAVELQRPTGHRARFVVGRRARTRSAASP